MDRGPTHCGTTPTSSPADVKVAQLYDAFSPLIPLSLEGYGFCERGEGGPFTDDGELEWPDGRLPVNTSGGGMSEAYVHGFNLVLEGVRQIRGTSTSQVDGADVSLVTSGEGVPTSAILFTEVEVTVDVAVPAARSMTSRSTAAVLGRLPGGELLVQAARRAARWRMPPRPMCPSCRSTRGAVGADVGARHDLVVHRPAPAAAARVRGRSRRTT